MHFFKSSLDYFTENLGDVGEEQVRASIRTYSVDGKILPLEHPTWLLTTIGHFTEKFSKVLIIEKATQAAKKKKEKEDVNQYLLTSETVLGYINVTSIVAYCKYKPG